MAYFTRVLAFELKPYEQFRNQTVPNFNISDPFQKNIQQRFFHEFLKLNVENFSPNHLNKLE